MKRICNMWNVNILKRQRPVKLPMSSDDSADFREFCIAYYIYISQCILPLHFILHIIFTFRTKYYIFIVFTPYSIFIVFPL